SWTTPVTDKSAEPPRSDIEPKGSRPRLVHREDLLHLHRGSQATVKPPTLARSSVLTLPVARSTMSRALPLASIAKRAAPSPPAHTACTLRPPSQWARTPRLDVDSA